MSKAISQMLMQPESNRLIIDFIENLQKIAKEHVDESQEHVTNHILTCIERKILPTKEQQKDIKVFRETLMTLEPQQSNVYFFPEQLARQKAT